MQQAQYWRSSRVLSHIPGRGVGILLLLLLFQWKSTGTAPARGPRLPAGVRGAHSD